MTKRKIEIVIEEKVRYMRGMTIETDLSDSELERVFDKLERTSDHPDDIALEFGWKQKGTKVLKPFDKDYSSPIESEVEIIEYDEVNE